MTWTAEARWAVPTAAGVVLFGIGLSLLVHVPLPAVVAVVVEAVARIGKRMAACLSQRAC